jgi:hypothetical protein
MTDPTPKTQGTFFRLTTEDLLFLTSILTDNELKVYLYLKSINPFTNNYKELDTAQIAENLGIKRRTAQRFVQKFKALDLIAVEVTRFKYRTKELISTSELESDPTIAKRSYDHLSDPTIAETILRSPKRSCDRIEEPEPLSDSGFMLSKINKNIKISHIPEGERDQKIENKENRSNQEENGFQELDKPNLQENQAIKEENIKSKVGVKGEFSPAAAIAKKTNQIENAEKKFDWLPPGPWAIDGKLDPHFRDAIAQDWVNRYGGDLHQRRADVLINFKKDPANLAIRWEQYSSEWHKRYENTHLQLANGVSIKPDYQKRLIENHRAITQPLPPELNPIAIPPGIEPGFILPSVETKAIAPTPATSSPKPDNRENAQAYEIWDAEPEADGETTQKYKALISDFLGKFGGGSKTREPEPEPPTELERLNSWLNDPILRSEVLKKVMASDRYSVEFNEEGNPFQIIEVKADG